MAVKCLVKLLSGWVALAVPMLNLGSGWVALSVKFGWRVALLAVKFGWRVSGWRGKFQICPTRE